MIRMSLRSRFLTPSDPCTPAYFRIFFGDCSETSQVGVGGTGHAVKKWGRVLREALEHLYVMAPFFIQL